MIKAPAEGMVVYAQVNNYSSNNPITEGTQVRERQVLLRLPDTSAMKAVVRINESQVSPPLTVGQKAIVKVTGIPEPISGVLTKISPVADSSGKYGNPTSANTPPRSPSIGRRISSRASAAARHRSR